MKKLVIFDLDDTLISSDAKIHVYDKSRHELETLTPAQFNHHKMNKNHFYDFNEFDDAKILNRSRIYSQTFNVMRRYLRMGEDVCILTARESHSLIFNFFKNHGCNIDKTLIFVVGSVNGEYSGSVPERKQQVLKELILRGYTNIRIYDDNIDNLEAMKKLETEDVKIKTIHVLHEA